MTRNNRTPLWLAAILLAPLTARAGDGTWNVDANGNWSDPANWSGGIVADGADSAANFTNINANRTVTLDSSRTIGGLSFSQNSGPQQKWILDSSNGSVLTLETSNGKPTISPKTLLTVSVPLAGNKGLKVFGPGDYDPEVTLSGTNTYTGGTIISHATVLISSDAALGDASGGISFDDDGLLRIHADLTLTRPITVTGRGGIQATAGQFINVSGQITGTSPSSGFTFSGSATIVVSSDNNYSGRTQISGTVRLDDGVGLPTASALALSGVIETHGTFTRSLGTNSGQLFWTGSGGFSAYGGPLTLQIGGSTNTLTWGSTNFRPQNLNLNCSDLTGRTSADNLVDFQNGIDLNGAVRTVYVGDNPASSSDVAQISGPIIGSGPSEFKKDGGGTLILIGTNSYAKTTISTGTLQIGNGGTTGSLGTDTVSLPFGGALAFNRSNSYIVNNTITSGNYVGQIFQRGLGTTSLAGDMANYTGFIEVSAGTLLINTSVGGILPVTLSGGTLSGTGSLGTRLILINAGGTLAPGASIESLDTGSVSFTAVGSRFNPEIDLGATLAADLLNVAGSITLSNSTLDVGLLNLPTSQFLPLTFLLMNNDATDPVTGEFGVIDSPIGFGVTVNYAFTGADALGRLGDGNDIAVTITPVPEPAAFVLALTAVAFLGRKKRK